MCVCMHVWGGRGGCLGDSEEEEEVVLKNAPLIVNRGARKDISDLLFFRIHLHLKNIIAFYLSSAVKCACVCVRVCAPLHKRTQMSSLIV